MFSLLRIPFFLGEKDCTATRQVLNLDKAVSEVFNMENAKWRYKKQNERQEDFKHTANYNSACGAKSTLFYADKNGKK